MAHLGEAGGGSGVEEPQHGEQVDSRGHRDGEPYALGRTSRQVDDRGLPRPDTAEEPASPVDAEPDKPLWRDTRAGKVVRRLGIPAVIAAALVGGVKIGHATDGNYRPAATVPASTGPSAIPSAVTPEQSTNPEATRPPKIYLGNMTEAEAQDLTLAEIMKIKTNNLDGTAEDLDEGQKIDQYTGPAIFNRWIQSVLSYPPYNKQLAKEARENGECPSLNLNFHDVEVDDPTFFLALCQAIRLPQVQDAFENNRRLEYFREQAIEGDKRNKLTILADNTAAIKVAVEVEPGSSITAMRYLLAFIIPNGDALYGPPPAGGDKYRPYTIAVLRISSGTYSALIDNNGVGNIK